MIEQKKTYYFVKWRVTLAVEGDARLLGLVPQQL